MQLTAHISPIYREKIIYILLPCCLPLKKNQFPSLNPHLVTEDTVSCAPLRRTTSAWQPRAEHCELRSTARTLNILHSHKLSSHHPRYVGVCKAKKTKKVKPVPRCNRKRGCNNELLSPKKRGTQRSSRFLNLQHAKRTFGQCRELETSESSRNCTGFGI